MRRTLQGWAMLLVILAYIGAVLYVYGLAYKAINKPEITKPPVCRSEFGQRIECED